MSIQEKDLSVERTAKFCVKGDIKVKQRPRATMIGGHATVYTPKDTINYENYIRSEFQRQCPNVFFGDTPLIVGITAFYLPPQDIKKLVDFDKIACCCHQDVDNLCKLFLDALNGIAYKDDRQVIDVSVSKRYSKNEYECVYVTITEDRYSVNIEDARAKTKLLNERNKISTRHKELLKKDKLTKAEKQRLIDIEKRLGEIKNELGE